MSLKKDFCFPPQNTQWSNAIDVGPQTYTCGYCGDKVSSRAGYTISHQSSGIMGVIRICPGCMAPTLFKGTEPFPGSTPGRDVEHVPEGLSRLYAEARECAAVGAYTASVMVCRKMLMNIAVEKKAQEGLSFKDYVDYLDSNHYIPPEGKGWADYIRKLGNKTNHEIELMEKKDATALITFIEMLLKIVYEFPQMVPKEPDQ